MESKFQLRNNYMSFNGHCLVKFLVLCLIRLDDLLLVYSIYKIVIHSTIKLKPKADAFKKTVKSIPQSPDIYTILVDSSVPS